MHIIGTDIAASSYERTDTLEILGLNALILSKEHASSQVLQPKHFSGESINILPMTLLDAVPPGARPHLLFIF